MTYTEAARRLRPLIEEAAQSLEAAAALEGVELYPKWVGDGRRYPRGFRVRHDGVLYSVLQEHSTQADWTPDAAHSLFARVLIPDPEDVPEWVQPDSTNPYKQGDKVKHGGKTWISDIDGNVWEPGVYGWTEEVAE